MTYEEVVRDLQSIADYFIEQSGGAVPISLEEAIKIISEMGDIVRCKDCIYYETCNLRSSHWWKGGYTVDIEFCSFGERREE